MKTALAFAGILAFAAAAPAAEITLDGAIDYALARSPAAVAADAAYLSARADLWQGWGNVMPQANATYSASRYYDRETLRIGGTPIPGFVPALHGYYASAQVNQPLFAGGALLWGVLSGRASARAGEADRASRRQQLTVDVARAYFGVLKAEGLKTAADGTLAANRANEELARANYDNGATSRAEYLKVVVLRGQAQVAAIAAEAGVATARLSFFNVAGMPPDAAATFAPVEAGAAEDYGALDGLIEEAMANRPDAVRTAAEKRKADLAVRSAAAGYIPSVGASATYDWSDTQPPSREDWDANDEWIVGLTASWNLFDGFQTKANMDRARAVAANARVAHDRLRDTVALDVTNAYYEYRRQAETLAVAKETAAAADEEFRLVNELYALGGASALELGDAQARNVEASNAYVNAKYDFLAADYDLRRALGRLR